MSKTSSILTNKPFPEITHGKRVKNLHKFNGFYNVYSFNGNKIAIELNGQIDIYTIAG